MLTVLTATQEVRTVLPPLGHTTELSTQTVYLVATAACPDCGRFSGELLVVPVAKMGDPARTIHALRKCGGSFQEVSEVLQADPDNPCIESVKDCNCGAE